MSFVSGCLGIDPGEAPLAEPGADIWELDAPSSRSYALTPDAGDVRLCEQLAERGIEPAGERSVAACAQRFACSRRMWRDDIAEEVYACIRQSRGDADPATACLAQVASRLEPSAARGELEAALADAERTCGSLMEIAPGQSDEVYELLTDCIQSNDECEAISACAYVELNALVDEVCGSLEGA